MVLLRVNRGHVVALVPGITNTTGWEQTLLASWTYAHATD
jgi:hypothetical protein